MGSLELINTQIIDFERLSAGLAKWPCELPESGTGEAEPRYSDTTQITRWSFRNLEFERFVVSQWGGESYNWRYQSIDLEILMAHHCFRSVKEIVKLKFRLFFERESK